MTRSIRLLTWTLAIWLAGVAVAAAQGRGTIRGTVVGPDGKPQGNVTLVLTNAAGVDRRQNSEPDGTFVIGGLVPGPYRLRVDDGAGTFAPWSQDQIAVVGGQTATIAISLAPRVAAAPAPTARATLAGTVIGPDGKPRGNVPVVLINPAGVERRGVTEPSGAYVFGGLQPGTYQVRIQEDFAQPFAMADLALAPGEKRGLEIRLQPLPPAPPPQNTGGGGGTVAGGGGGGQPGPLTLAPRREFVVPETTFPTEEFQAMPNRWDFEFPEYRRYSPPEKMPWVIGGPLDPYNQNTLKADFPLGDTSLFANLNLQANSNFNPRTVGGGIESVDQVVNNNNFVTGFEIFSGDTVFEPKRWAIRATAVANLNRASVADLDAVVKKNFALEEGFIERRLAVLSPSFDFVSVRAGMQNFNSDFRGYVFIDNQLGVRLFGNAGANRSQYNAAFFSMRDRDGVTNLHEFTNRNQNVFIGNWFLQDFGAQGYTGLFNVHVNNDGGLEGDEFPLNVFYLGFHGDGKWGPWSVSHAFYQAFGSDDGNRIAGLIADGGPPLAVDINGRMAAVELARDADWKRFRFSLFYASGDNADDPDKATGFDSIIDNPNLAGGQFMFWTQQAQNAGGRLLSNGFSLLPNLRNKFTDRSNFVNPGVIVLNGGVDLRFSPKLKVVTNVSHLRFADNSVLQALVDRGEAFGFEDNSIGLDFSVGAKFRPFVNENLFIVPGFSMLSPAGGFKTALGGSGALYSFFTTINVAY